MTFRKSPLCANTHSDLRREFSRRIPSLSSKLTVQGKPRFSAARPNLRDPLRLLLIDEMTTIKARQTSYIPRTICFVALKQIVRTLYSHSIVAGGLLVISYTILFACLTSLVIRVEMCSNTSKGMRAQSAVIASTLVTARNAITFSYVRKSPCTPTVLLFVITAKYCHISRFKPALADRKSVV